MCPFIHIKKCHQSLGWVIIITIIIVIMAFLTLLFTYYISELKPKFFTMNVCCTKMVDPIVFSLL